MAGTLYTTTTDAGGPAVTGGTFDSILKEFYLGPVQEQLNQEVLALELFEKASVDWNGKHCIIPVHTARNTGVGVAEDGGSIPSATQQQYSSLQIRAKFLYGRFSVTGPAIAAAGKGSANSFVSYVDAEMTALVNDVRDKANKYTLFGGRVKGCISNRQSAWDVAVTGSGNAIQVDVIYDGDFSAFTDAASADDTTWVHVRLYRADTLAELVLDAVGGTDGVNSGWFISDGSAAAYGAATGLLELSAVSDGNADEFAMATLGPVAPHGVIVALHETRFVGAGTIGPDTTATINYAAGGDAATLIEIKGSIGTMANSLQPTGIFGNLAAPTLYGVDRTTATATDASLQSTVVTQDTDATVTRGDLTLSRMQQMFDECLQGSGQEPDYILMSPLQRQKYVARVGSNMFTYSDKATKGDGGFLSLSYAGVPIESSKDCPNGIVIFLKKDTWKLTELQTGGFADLDGNVLSRTAGFDSYHGFYRWYWNLVCTKPAANAILVGLTLTSDRDGWGVACCPPSNLQGFYHGI